jgi:hypothetical protein
VIAAASLSGADERPPLPAHHPARHVARSGPALGETLTRRLDLRGAKRESQGKLRGKRGNYSLRREQAAAGCSPWAHPHGAIKGNRAVAMGAQMTRPRPLRRHALSPRLGGQCPRRFLCRAANGQGASFSFPHRRHEARSTQATPARPAGQEPSASRPDPSTAMPGSAPTRRTSNVDGVRSTSSS